MSKIWHFFTKNRNFLIICSLKTIIFVKFRFSFRLFKFILCSIYTRIYSFKNAENSDNDKIAKMYFIGG